MKKILLYAFAGIILSCGFVRGEAIDIGPGAEDRASATTVALQTRIALDNAANATGVLTSFEVWYNTDATEVKMGTFSGSGTDYDDRDYETIGDVASGSKQTFTGKNCDVVTGDFLGIYQTTGYLERVSTGGNAGGIAEDTFGQGVHTYSTSTNIYSIYATGTTISTFVPKIIFY